MQLIDQVSSSALSAHAFATLIGDTARIVLFLRWHTSPTAFCTCSLMRYRSGRIVSPGMAAGFAKPR
jgi:hypothetical protein